MVRTATILIDHAVFYVILASDDDNDNDDHGSLPLATAVCIVPDSASTPCCSL